MDYDAEAWLDWMFYTFLNAVALATAHLVRASEGQREVEVAGELPFD